MTFVGKTAAKRPKPAGPRAHDTSGGGFVHITRNEFGDGSTVGTATEFGPVVNVFVSHLCCVHIQHVELENVAFEHVKNQDSFSESTHGLVTKNGGATVGIRSHLGNFMSLIFMMNGELYRPA